MMRAFYKSRLFWLGLPGLVFLLWVWWDSGGCRSSALWTRADRWSAVLVNEGRLQWTESKVPASMQPYLSTAEPFSFERTERSVEAMLAEEELGMKAEARGRQFDFAAAFERDAEVRAIIAGDLAEWRVALWVVVLGYVVVWMGAVMAWQRRRARVMKGLTDAVREREVMG